MNRLKQEVGGIGRLFAKNPGMVFLAMLVVGVAGATAVKSCRQRDFVLSGSMHMSRALDLSDAVWHGRPAQRGLLRVLAYPRPAKRPKAPEKPAAPRANPPGPGQARTSCGSLADLRFPEFNLLIPPL